jgi:hypothetical protein
MCNALSLLFYDVVDIYTCISMSNAVVTLIDRNINGNYLGINFSRKDVVSVVMNNV